MKSWYLSATWFCNKWGETPRWVLNICYRWYLREDFNYVGSIYNLQINVNLFYIRNLSIWGLCYLQGPQELTPLWILRNSCGYILISPCLLLCSYVWDSLRKVLPMNPWQKKNDQYLIRKMTETQRFSTNYIWVSKLWKKGGISRRF